MRKKILYLLVLVLLILVLYLGYRIYTQRKPLQVIFFDIGQGDSILIQKGTRQVLIDGGPSGKTALAKLGAYLPYFDRQIDIVIPTHPDQDHIGGLVDVARNYQIGKVLATAAEKDTQVFREWKDLLSYHKVETIEVWRGAQIKLGDARMKVIYPAGRVDPTAGDANDKSVVARFDFGEDSFLLTGDIEFGGEQLILESGENIGADVLKVAHHGSKSSSSERFVDAVSPETAVISVGADNRYGHPAEVVLDVLWERNIEILRTDEAGDIVYNCENSKCKYQSSK